MYVIMGLDVMNRRFHILYQSPALWGETLNVAAHLVALRSMGGTWFITIERASDNTSIIQCVIEWTLANRVGGEEVILPADLFGSLQKRVVA